MSERCPACGAAGRPLSLTVEGRYRLFSCRNCRTQFFREAATAAAAGAANLDSEYWEPHKYAYYSDPSVRAAFAQRYDALMGAAEQAVGPIRSVLDVGCGTGNFLDYGRSRGIDAWGVDLDPEPVAEARSRGLQAVAMADMDNAGMPLTFDALTMWDVVEHIVDPLGAIKEVLPRLKPGGALLFETPDGGFPLRRAVLAAHRATAGRLDYTPPLYYWEHKIYFTAPGFRALMQRLGCEVVDLRRGISIREKMDAVLAHEAEETGSRWLATLSRTWPVLARTAQAAHLGNKLLVVARKR